MAFFLEWFQHNILHRSLYLAVDDLDAAGIYIVFNERCLHR